MIMKLIVGEMNFKSLWITLILMIIVKIMKIIIMRISEFMSLAITLIMIMIMTIDNMSCGAS